jgi:hypothetical protein
VGGGNIPHFFGQIAIRLRLGGMLVVVVQFPSHVVSSSINDELNHPGLSEDSEDSCQSPTTTTPTKPQQQLHEHRFPSLHDFYYSTSAHFVPGKKLWNMGVEVGSLGDDNWSCCQGTYSDVNSLTIFNNARSSPRHVHIRRKVDQGGLQDGDEEINLFLAGGDGFFMECKFLSLSLLCRSSSLFSFYVCCPK